MAPTSDQQHAINEVSQALQHKARFIFWDDSSHCFAYFRYQDNNKFKQFIKNMKRLARVANGEILEIATDPRFEINGVTLYPMIIKFKNCLCPSYMHLVRKSTDNSKWSPFLFTSKKRRTKTVNYLTNFYTIIRVNATSTIPHFQIIQKFETTSELALTIKSLIDPESTVTRIPMSFWCMDDKRQEIDVWVDEEVRDKNLQPNHRANALAEAGRFKNMLFDDIGKRHRVTKNQQLKESQGANYFVGDVCLVVKGGKPYPNFNVYGENPIKFITNINPPSQGMITRYGEDLAKKMIDPEKTVDFQSLFHRLTELRGTSYDLSSIVSRNDKHRQRIIMIDVLKRIDNVTWNTRKYATLSTASPIETSFAQLLCKWLPLCETDRTCSRSDPVRFVAQLFN